MNASRTVRRQIQANWMRSRVAIAFSYQMIFGSILTINGSESGLNGQMDEYLISFCHLSEVHPLSDAAPELGVPDAARWFVIADHSIGVHPYVIRLSESATEPATVAVVYNEFVVPIAQSFDAFLEGYCDRNQDMLFPDVPPEWTAKYGAPAI